MSYLISLLKRCSLFLPLLFALQNSSAADLRLLTYNTGLANTFVPYKTERLPHIIAALKNDPADVLCLQEVWEKKDRMLIQESLKTLYPYAHDHSARQTFTDSRPACTPLNLVGQGKFGTCLAKNCLKKKGDEFTSCIIDTCREPMNRLKQENRQCAAALFGQVGNSVLKSLWNVLSPFKKVGLFAYEGASGLMVLSKFPLKNKSTLELSHLSTTNRRAALYAEIQLENKNLHTLCTHLTSNLNNTIPYTGTSENWEGENLDQVNELLIYLDSKAATNPQAIMGDLNCSLEDTTADIGGEFQNSCLHLEKNSFVNYFARSTPECTFCPDNILVSEGNDTTNKQPVLIDHIWLKNYDQIPFEMDIIFKELITLKDKKSPQQEKQTQLSDHFGLRYILDW